jgi:hypothetical protein
MKVVGRDATIMRRDGTVQFFTNLLMGAGEATMYVPPQRSVVVWRRARCGTYLHTTSLSNDL